MDISCKADGLNSFDNIQHPYQKEYQISLTFQSTILKIISQNKHAFIK